MRIHAAVAIFLAAAANLSAGDDAEGGAELLYEFQDGEAPAAAIVLEKRLQLLGIEGATVKPVEDARRVVVRLQKRDSLEDVRTVAGWVGRLELRRAADTDTREYMERRVAFQLALRREEDIEKVRDIPADSLSAEERKRAPDGLRWYRNPSQSSRADDWVLCEMDGHGITQEALDDPRVSPLRADDVLIDIKEDFQKKTANLLRKPFVIIVDGEAISAPYVRRQTADCVTLRVEGEREARVVVAALGCGVLPSKPTFVGERRIEVAVPKREDGVELLYEFQAGEAEAAVKVLGKRLQLLGVEGAAAEAVEDGKRVLVRLASRDRLEDVRMVAERTGHLELRRAVDSDAQECRSRRVALDVALKHGDDLEKARAVPVESLGAEERQRWPGGLRWYKNPSPTNSPTDDWLLCEIDRLDVTEAALEEIRVMPSYREDDMFGVHFSIKPELREKMAELTSVENTRVAIIVDGEMLCAPVVHSQLTRNGEISVKGEREARVLAATLGGGVLPSKPALVAERRIER